MLRNRSGMPFAGGMRNHDDGDSFWQKGMDALAALPDCKSVLQLLGDYHARKKGLHA